MHSADGRSPVVFVTYAHDSKKHKDDVRALATLLEDSGIATELDQWVSERQDWSSWAIEKMMTADYIVVVASPDYRAAGDGIGITAVNRGVRSETAVLRDLLHHDRATWVRKLLPVVLPGRRIDEIPYFLQPHVSDHYVVSEISKAGIEHLLRVITAQPGRLRPARGKIPVLPPHPEHTADQPWTPLDEPVAVSWRADLVDLRGRQQVPTLEVHLAAVGGERLQVRRLAPLAEELAGLGRRHRVFDIAEQLTVGSSDQDARALTANTSDKGTGLVVLRAGQRSAWSALPRAQIGRLLIHEDVVTRVAGAVTALLELDLPAPARFAPAVALEPLDLVRIGRTEDLTASSGQLHMSHPAHIRVPAEESFTVDHLRHAVAEVAEELATRLLAAFRRECR